MAEFTFFTMSLSACAAVLVLVPPMRRWAVRSGFVDRPGGRKQHDMPVPPVGGLLVFPVFMAVSILAGADMVRLWPLFGALTMILVTGALDDRFHMNAWIKFFVQFSAALLIVLPGGAQVFHLGDLFGLGTQWLGFLSVPFSVFCTVLLINAVNLMDGLDGLAAGQSFVSLFWLALAAFFAGNDAVFGTITVLMGALAGFLFYNVRHPWRARASIFLGDAGSMALGLILAWYCITLAQGREAALAPVAVAWIIALPVIDACGQFIRRMREGRHPFDPDRGHFHHHFIHAGFSAGRTTFLILALVFTLGLIGYGGAALGVPQPLLMAGWTALLFTHVLTAQKPQRFIAALESVRAGR